MKKYFALIFLLLQLFMNLKANEIEGLGKDYDQYDIVAAAMFATGTLAGIIGRQSSNGFLIAVGSVSTTASILTIGEAQYLKTVRDWEIAQVDFLNRVSLACKKSDQQLMLEQLNLLPLYHLFFSTESFNRLNSLLDPC